MAHVILVPRPGIEPVPLHWNHEVLSTGPPGKSPLGVLKPAVATKYLQYHRVGLQLQGYHCFFPNSETLPKPMGILYSEEKFV